MAQVESYLEKNIIQSIRNNGGYVIKNQASATTGKGRPDLSACIKGNYVAMEVKRKSTTRKTTVAQLRHLFDVARAGGLAFITASSEVVNYATNYKNPNYTSKFEFRTPPIDDNHTKQAEILLESVNEQLRRSNFQWLEITHSPIANHYHIAFFILDERYYGI